MSRSYLALACWLLSAPMATAQQAPDEKLLAGGDINALVTRVATSRMVTFASAEQNKQHQGLTQDDIDRLDKVWRRERKASSQPLISATLSSPLSSYLTRFQARSKGLILESFVMDARGLNVGQSSITSDYWQGDEAKFQKSFGSATNTDFIDKAEWDDDLKIWKAQISRAIADPDSKGLIGAITIEINLDELQRRRIAGAALY